MKLLDYKWDYIEKNCVKLFDISVNMSEMTSQEMYIDCKTGQPFILKSWAVHIAAGADTSHFDAYLASFEELHEKAKTLSRCVYEKYKGMNENNWKEYI